MLVRRRAVANAEAMRVDPRFKSPAGRLALGRLVTVLFATKTAYDFGTFLVSAYRNFLPLLDAYGWEWRNAAEVAERARSLTALMREGELLRTAVALRCEEPVAALPVAPPSTARQADPPLSLASLRGTWTAVTPSSSAKPVPYVAGVNCGPYVQRIHLMVVSVPASHVDPRCSVQQAESCVGSQRCGRRSARSRCLCVGNRVKTSRR